MAKRNFTVQTNRFETPRRSERILRRNSTSEPRRPRIPMSNNGAQQASAPHSVENVAKRNSTVQTNRYKTTRRSERILRQNSTSEPLPPTTPNNGVHQIPALRRSSRLSNQQGFVEQHEDHPKKSAKKSSSSGKCLSDSENLIPKLRKSTTVNADVAQSLRRSQRLLTKLNAVMGSDQKTKKVKSMVNSGFNSNVPVNGAGQVPVPNAEVEGGSFELAVELTPEPRKSTTRELMIELTPTPRKTAASKLTVELRLEGGETKSRNLDEGKLKIEDGERKEKKEDKGKVQVHRKRKRGEEGEQVTEGWTKEQLEALRKACLAAKPTPHFWKNVSKMVPGKSAQDCFDRVNNDYSTPPQPKPRSRTNKIKSQCIEEFLLSPSKLLIPTVKGTKRLNLGKAKNYLTRKYIEELQDRCKMDQDHDGDLFSVLEPDVKFSSNTLQPSSDLATPKQLKEKLGLLESCSGLSSSGHKKSLSRFSKSSSTDLASPPVLKPVKNKVLHEKYIDKLRCRRVESERAKKSIAKKSVNGENKVQKDAVKAARKALMSQARDAINKFQQSRAFIGGSDDDDNDDIRIGSADEDAEDENE
ncbi:hypothetical protein L6164_027367 [Bauhinia variegata]|uniref:Uncharacterized protein n=1 Tax=Bauhinia variegata TaxID=167791 RepID=A0ACB9LTE2_BAUVA|nr:hypothetical protein L6164_027367 [Bauhinia variegata]